MVHKSSSCPLRSKITLAITGVLSLVSVAFAAQAQTVGIDQIQHIHGIAPDPLFPGAVILGTHEGTFRALPNGDAMRVSKDTSDFMSLAAHPNTGKTLFASGHPASGGNSGLLKSTDGGVSWIQIATGDAAKADFHLLSLSPKNPDVIYGAYKGLQVSRDGGTNWTVSAPLPDQLFSLAASSQNADTLFAGTMNGLSVSKDGGNTWQSAHPEAKPVTAIHVTPDGRLYAFIYGAGLMTAMETNSGGDLQWEILSSAFQDRALLKLVIDPRDAQRMFGLAGTQQLMTSGDGGRSWTNFVGYLQQTTDAVSAGKAIYEDNCSGCHGVDGVGERPDDPGAQDEYGFVAPAMNDSAHAWHHPDAQLLETIRDGSSRNERMQPWKDDLSDAEIKNVIAYMKSLWSFRSLACQGAKHMACMN